MTRVWVIDDDRSIRWVLEQALVQEGMTARSFADGRDALDAASNGETPDVVIADIRMPDIDGLTLLQKLHARHAGLPVIIITAHSDLDSAVSAYRSGAFEYLPKPFDIDHAVDLVRRAAASSVATTDTAEPVSEITQMIGKAPAMQAVFRAIGRLANSSMAVLITGESGTGKELVARALHQNSPRASQPFVALNVSAIASELLESELFGHERGSFTGAEARRLGRFEQANGGTLFLDEIGDMPPPLQTRLLRVLAEGEFYRVGGKDPIQVDVRVIAATHQDLEKQAAKNLFREDLYHRLNVIHIPVPPLRERREDIELLLPHYLAEAAREIGIAPKTISAQACRLLTAFEWPGNVRQLINACRRLTALAPGGEIQTGDIPAEFGGAVPDGDDDGWAAQLARHAEQRLATGDSGLLEQLVPEFERTLIETALRVTGGKRQQAAKLLGWGRNTLTRKMRELEMN